MSTRVAIGSTTKCILCDRKTLIEKSPYMDKPEYMAKCNMCNLEMFYDEHDELNDALILVATSKK